MIGGTIEMQRIMNLQIIVFIILCISRWNHQYDPNNNKCDLLLFGWHWTYVLRNVQCMCIVQIGGAPPICTINQ